MNFMVNVCLNSSSSFVAAPSTTLVFIYYQVLSRNQTFLAVSATLGTAGTGAFGIFDIYEITEI